eukprot:COSAG01_NODE_58372_length_306_cov_1.188406_1_plen_73_part_01
MEYYIVRTAVYGHMGCTRTRMCRLGSGDGELIPCWKALFQQGMRRAHWPLPVLVPRCTAVQGSTVARYRAQPV